MTKAAHNQKNKQIELTKEATKTNKQTKVVRKQRQR
jgi:hypothetical protein